jgi:signal transduction histidine kinase
VNPVERLFERLRAFRPLLVDSVLAVLCATISLTTVFTQEVESGYRSPTAAAVFTTALVCAPIVARRRWPLVALLVSCVGILVHIVGDMPEGSLPAVTLLLTYSVATYAPIRRSVWGLLGVFATIAVLAVTGSPGLDGVELINNMAIFAVAWLIGVVLRGRRETVESRVRAADERANTEQQRAARVLAEERLRIAQELHDVLAHSMSVIAVQAGVGAHVLDQRPEQARAALEAISATSRGTLTEMRRLLGALRDDAGERSHMPAPAIADLPRLVDDVRGAGVPVHLSVEGTCDGINPGIELSAYRVVQEALTNVIKHAGVTSRVDVRVEHLPGALRIEVVDDGRGAAAAAAGAPAATAANGHDGHGLLGMRERVELWGGELAVGPVTGGGYRVCALLPYGEPA